MNEPRMTVALATETTVNPCQQGHAWQPTIFIGYFQCSRCRTLAACALCVSKMRSNPLVGVCQQHQRAGAPAQTTWEVLA